MNTQKQRKRREEKKKKKKGRTNFRIGAADLRFHIKHGPHTIPVCARVERGAWLLILAGGGGVLDFLLLKRYVLKVTVCVGEKDRGRRGRG